MAWREEPPKSGRWRNQIWITGKPVKLTFRGTKAEARAYEAKRRQELGDLGVVRRGQVPTFERFSTIDYKAHARGAMRRSSWRVRKSQLVQLIPHFGATRLTDIDEQQIAAYKAHRLTRVSKATINQELLGLSAVLTYARTIKVPAAKPKLSRFKVTRKRGSVQFYTRDEVGFILAATRLVVPDLLPLLRFLFDTGVRKSEAIHLPWSRVKLDERLVLVWSSADGEDDGYEVKATEREIPISDAMLLLLKEQKLRVGSSPWVFPVYCGRTTGQRYYSFPDRSWRIVLTKANELARAANPDARDIAGGVHRTRHTYASHFLAAKPDLFLLGRLLGHTNTDVTEIYAHLVPNHLAEARNVVDFGAPPKPTLAPTLAAPTKRTKAGKNS